MRLRKVTIYSYMLIFFYLCENEFFKIVNLNYTYVKAILFGLGLLSLIILYFDRELQKKVFDVSKFLNRFYIFLILVFLLPQFIYTHTHYGQGVYGFITASYHFTFVFLASIYLYIFHKQGGFCHFMNKFTTVVCVGLFLNIINSFIYNLTGVLILEVSYKFRDDLLRTYGLSSVLGIMCIYTGWRVLIGNSTKLQKIEAVIAFVALFYCAQTRIMEICVVITMLYIYLRYQNSTRKKVYAFLAVALGMVVLIQMGAIEAILNSFSTTGAYSGSTNSRIREIIYYVGMFRENPIWGIGLLEVNSTIGFNLIRGPLGKNYPTDVGYIGSLGNMGLSYAIVLGVLFVRWAYIVKKYRRHSTKELVLCESLFLFIFTSGVTLLITDAGRILGLAIVIAIFEWTHFHCGQMSERRGMIDANGEESIEKI